MKHLPELGTAVATQIASSADPSMLRQIVTAIAQVTGSRSAYIERYNGALSDVEIVAAYGPASPPVGARVPDADTRPDAITFPLSVDGHSIGAIVCIDAPASVALNPSQPGQIELLGTLAASALRNVGLVRELELATSNAVERRFRLLNGLVLYLKNTLGAAGEYVQLIETESELTTRQHGYVASSQRNIEVALRLLTELVDLGRVETGRLAVESEPVKPSAILRGIVRDYELANGMSGIHFDLVVSDALPVIETDVDLMRRILDTLLSNAVKYTAAGGHVRITADVREGRRATDPQQFVCITVHDQGPGVADRELVFEEVARAESTTTTPGFRLAISRRISRLLGGDLSLDKSDEGGSSFSLWLPTASSFLPNEHPTFEGTDAYGGTTLAERQ